LDSSAADIYRSAIAHTDSEFQLDGLSDEAVESAFAMMKRLKKDSGRTDTAAQLQQLQASNAAPVRQGFKPLAYSKSANCNS
jgi:hypothetical protein